MKRILFKSLNGWAAVDDPDRINYHHDINGCVQFIMKFRDRMSFPSDETLTRRNVKRQLKHLTPFKESYVAGLLVTRIEI